MQATNPAAEHPQALPEHLGRVVRTVRPDVRRAGQPAVGLLVVVLREQVGALVPLQLQPVLEQAEELVRGEEFGPVLAGDVPTVAQGAERLDGAGDAQVLVRAAVDHLQQLHRELDVAQTPASEFEFAVAQGLGHVLLDASPHRLHVVHEIVPLGGGPDHRVDGVVISGRQRHVARHGTRLELGLELPRLGPTGVVGLVGVERADQLARSTLRAQRRVDLEERHRPDAHHLSGHTAGPRVGGLGDEDDVDVRDVVELARPALAHGHHPEPGRHRRVRVDGGHGDGEGRGQRGVGEIRQAPTHLGEREHGLVVLDRRGDVMRGQQGHVVAVGRTEHVDRGAAGDPGAVGPDTAQVLALGRCRRVLHGLLGDGLDRTEHARQDVLGRGEFRAHQRPAGGLGDQVVPQRARRSEQTQEPRPQPRIRTQRVIQRRDAGVRTGPGGAALAVGFGRERLPQPHQGTQREVRVRRPRQRPQYGDRLVVGPPQVAEPVRGPVVEQTQPAWAR